MLERHIFLGTKSGPKDTKLNYHCHLIRVTAALQPGVPIKCTWQGGVEHFSYNWSVCWNLEALKWDCSLFVADMYDRVFSKEWLISFGHEFIGPNLHFKF